QGHVVRVVVDDYAGVRSPPVQFGMDVVRGCHIPFTLDHHTVGVYAAYVGGRDLLPPQPPRVDEETAVVTIRPGDVAGHIFAESAVRQGPERTGERLLVREVDPDRWCGPRLPPAHRIALTPSDGRFVVHGHDASTH